MIQSLLQPKRSNDAALNPSHVEPADHDVSDLFGQLSLLAKIPLSEERVIEAPKTFPDFNHVQNISGRWYRTSDAIAILLSFVCGGLIAWGFNSWILQDGFQKIFSIATLEHFAASAAVCLAAMLWFDTKGHYRQRLPHWEMVGHVLTVAFLGLVCSGFVQFAIKEPTSRLWVGLSWTLFVTFLFLGRNAAYRILQKRGEWEIPALVIGEGPTAQRVLRALARERKMGYTIARTIPAAALDKLTKTYEWKSLLMKNNACHVFIALEGSETERHGASLKSLARAWVPFSIVPPWFGLPSSTLSSHHFMMQDVFLLHDTNRLQLPLPCFMKRSLDIVVSSLALLVLAVPFIGIALWVRRDGGPAFFSQPRVGRNGKMFACHKFRSMRPDAERLLTHYLAENPDAAAEWQKFQKLKHDVRITPFGHFIRRFSIDELPQFFNVLMGDMSLVGPRPILPGQERLYTDDFCFYESVRPGITGPWQVSGRSLLTFKERVELESWYARNWSLWVDIVIMLKTIPALMKKDQVC